MNAPRRVLLTTAAAAAVVMTGCSSGGEIDGPRPVPTTSTTIPTPTPTPTTSVSAVPEPAAETSEFTEDAAVQFAVYYHRVVENARDTLDTTTLTKISDPNCAGCQAQIDQVVMYRDRGYRWVDGTQTFQSVSFDDWRVATREADLTLNVHNNPGRIVDRDGVTLKEWTTGRDGYLQVTLGWSEGGWIVRSAA